MPTPAAPIAPQARLPRPRVAPFPLLLALLGLSSTPAWADVGVFGSERLHQADVVAKIQAASDAAGLGLGRVVGHVLCNAAAPCEPTPSLAQLQAYSAVLVYSERPFADREALGNVLADYVDAGGTVVVNVFAIGHNDPQGRLQGRLVSNNHLPVTVTTQADESNLTLVPTLPTHPLLQGVHQLHNGTSGYHAPVSLTAGATLVANWSNGSPLIATKGNVVALNFFPASSDARDDLWDASTDGGRIMANALAWPMLIENPELPAGKVNVAHTGHNLTASQGTAPIAWGASHLPAGIALNATGELSGTPTAAGVWPVEVTFQDSQAPTPRQRTQTLPLRISPVDATAGQPYSQALGTSGRFAGQTMAVTGLPNGLRFEPATGLISGTATAQGDFPLTVTFTDPATSATSGPYALTLSVRASSALAVQPVPALGALGLGLMGLLTAAAGVVRSRKRH